GWFAGTTGAGAAAPGADAGHEDPRPLAHHGAAADRDRAAAGGDAASACRGHSGAVAGLVSGNATDKPVRRSTGRADGRHAPLWYAARLDAAAFVRPGADLCRRRRGRRAAGPALARTDQLARRRAGTGRGAGTAGLCRRPSYCPGLLIPDFYG